MKKNLIVVLLILALFSLVSCVPGDGRNTMEEPGHLLWGIWHGWIAPISLIISIFRDNASIYEINNTGFWYDLGFYAAIIGGFGSLTLSRKRHKEKD